MRGFGHGTFVRINQPASQPTRQLASMNLEAKDLQDRESERMRLQSAGQTDMQSCHNDCQVYRPTQTLLSIITIVVEGIGTSVHVHPLRRTNKLLF